MSDDERLNVLFDELVPPSGKSDSLAGELVRAVSQIGYRFFNGGDQLGKGYGKTTCNPAGLFLIRNAPELFGNMVKVMCIVRTEEVYEAILDCMISEMADYIEANPSLREQPSDDMWSYRTAFPDMCDLDSEDSDIWDDEED